MAKITQISDRSFSLDRDLPGWGAFRSGWSNTIAVNVADSADESFAGTAALDAVRWLAEQSDVLAQATLDAIFREYPTIVRNESANFDEAERAGFLPVLNTAEELAARIQLSEFTLFGLKDDQVEFGVLLIPPWDEEHQLGVRGVGHRIIGVGDGDYACY